MPEGHLLLQTLRSHDPFNTTIYGHDGRYRALAGGRHVVMVHPDDLARLGLGPESSCGSSRPAPTPSPGAGGGAKAGSDHAHRSDVQPKHLS